MIITPIRNKIFELEPKHIDAMKKVKDGGNVYSVSLANNLREVQVYDHELIDIVPVPQLETMGFEFSNDEDLPYFGAILTDKGKAYLNQHKN